MPTLWWRRRTSRMWRMDSLSVGISILCSGGKGPSYLGCRLSVVSASPSSSRLITIDANAHTYLVEKAIDAAISAIEVYNKPRFRYREETFAILMLNAWELLLK